MSSRFNSAISTMRRANLDGVYDTHTNMMFYPKIMQPTHARWEQIPPPHTGSDQKQLTYEVGTDDHLTNGSLEHVNHDSAMDVESIPRGQQALQPSLFSDVSAVVSRNFAVIDVHYTAPPISGAGYPGQDGGITDPTSGPNGLGSIRDDIIDELPTDCRRAFEEAKRAESSWARQWTTEARNGLRGDLRIGLNGYPV